MHAIPAALGLSLAAAAAVSVAGPAVYRPALALEFNGRLRSAEGMGPTAREGVEQAVTQVLALVSRT